MYTKSPDRRYQSMPELIEDLKRSLMNPDENFVKVVDRREEDSTRVITEKEVKEIKQQVQKRSTVTGDSIRLRKEVEEERKNKKKIVREEEEYEEYDPKMEKITTILAVIIAVIAGIVIIFLVGKFAGVFPSSKEEQNGAQAQTQQEQENSTAGFLEDDSMIGLPQVVGWGYAEASAALKQNGYEVTKEEVFSPDVPKGNVISQNPEAGVPLAQGSIVTLRVSLGAEITKVRVPSIVGYTQVEAATILEQEGLLPGKVEETTNEDSNLIGKVCYQSYSVGAYVDSGTVIDMKISTGVGNATYSFVGNIAGPGEEDGDYIPGTEVTVIVASSSGQEIYRTITNAFPLPMNVTGITGSEDGLVTFHYVVDIPATTTTDDAGNVITLPGGREERSISRAVKFTKES